jgi:protein ImuB
MAQRDYNSPGRDHNSRQLSLYAHNQRLACINVPALPLQLLLKKHPDWSAYAAAVVDHDTPQGKILWVNQKAWGTRIRPGQSYGEGLSLDPGLRAGVITSNEIEDGVDAIVSRLTRFSPEIEPSRDLAGIFWLNAAGMTLLFPSLDDWADSIRKDLEAFGVRSRMAVGFSRFGSYALARSTRKNIVVEDPHQEEDLSRKVPLERLDLAPKLRDTLAKLGIHTVGTFLRLPAGGILQRFGQEAYRLHRLANGDLWAPLTPQAPEAPIEQRILLDEPISSVSRLLHIIEDLLAPVLEAQSSKGMALSALHLLLVLDTRDHVIETLKPAEPTLDKAVLLELVKLRLHTTQLPAGVIELEFRGEAVPANREQLSLQTITARRDLAAADRALARVRAEFGEEAVVAAQLREGHLPEAGFTWTAFGKLPEAKPRKIALRPLIRRIQASPSPLPARPRNERNDNWFMQGLEYGSVVRMLGPYIVSGGWWMSAIHREYHFIETRRGDLLWAYYDQRRRRWYLHGRVD